MSICYFQVKRTSGDTFCTEILLISLSAHTMYTLACQVKRNMCALDELQLAYLERLHFVFLIFRNCVIHIYY